MQAAFAVLAGLFVTLGLSRLKVPLGAAFVLGAIALGLIAGEGLGGTAEALGAVTFSKSTWLFACLVAQVFLLSTVMRISGAFDVLVLSAGAVISNRRVRLASLPALVGLLPMPGGAVVSAPLIDQTRSDVPLSPKDKNLINYWFRHIWEVCWPLYPPLLLAVTFMPEESLTLLCLIQLPLMVILVALGWWFILREVPRGADGTRAENPGTKKLIWALAPLLTVIICVPLVRPLADHWVSAEHASEASLAASLLLALVVAGGGSFFSRMLAAAKEPKVWVLFLLAFGVKIFGGMVAISGAAQGVAILIRDGGLPPLIAVIALPFFVGVVSGATIAMVSVSFPVIVALATPADPLLAWLVLAYAIGFAGYMLSPVHMCLVLSSRFFGEGVSGAYSRLWAPIGLFSLGAGLLYWILAVSEIS